MNERDASNAVAPMLLARAELRHVGVEQTAHVDHRIAIVEGRDVERHDDGVVVGVLHRLGDRRVGVGVTLKLMSRR